MKRVLIVVFGVFVCLCGSVGELAAETSCDIASTAMQTASKLRGLGVRQKVPCRLQNKKQVEQYLLDAINNKIPAEKLKNEERVYKQLGFIPREFRYKEGLIELYTSQLGGYYDPEKDYYAMAAWIPQIMQPPIAVHELVHALQDQHFDLDDLIDHKKQTSDALMARSALVEGDATAVMLDYSRQLQGQGSIEKEKSISGFMLQNISGAMFSTSLQSTPPALQALLIFPYVSGLRFAHELLKKGGYSEIDRAFSEPPKTTEQILHPEIYLSGQDGFIELDTPRPPADIDGVLASPEAMFTDRVGEFALTTLLGTWVPPLQASKAAVGWGGDALALYELEGTSRGLLVWELHWDSEDEAKEFFNIFVEAYTKRFDKAPVTTTTTALWVDPELGPVRIQLRAEDVSVMIGGGRN